MRMGKNGIPWVPWDSHGNGNTTSHGNENGMGILFSFRIWCRSLQFGEYLVLGLKSILSKCTLSYSLILAFLLLVAGWCMDATARWESNIPGDVSPTRLLHVIFRREDPVYVESVGVSLSAVTETCCSHSYCNCWAAEVWQNYTYDFSIHHLGVH